MYELVSLEGTVLKFKSFRGRRVTRYTYDRSTDICISDSAPNKVYPLTDYRPDFQQWVNEQF